jgi:translocator protein
MTTQPLPPQQRRAWVPAVVSVGAALAVGAIGGLATASSVETWYPSLNKPVFNPPNAVFGPVWTTLYVLMAVAAWRVWRAAPPGVTRQRAIGLYSVQLVLNLAWSLIFFGLRQPDLALVELVVLLAAVLATTAVFFRIDRPAGWLMVPYGAWVSFAGLLNFEIWRLNG